MCRNGTNSKGFNATPGKMNRVPKVIVVGAGIAGLTAAFRLQQAQCEVLVLEQAGTERVGGRMATIFHDGFYLDVAASRLPSSYSHLYNLAIDAGLGSRILPASGVAGMVCQGTIKRFDATSRLRTAMDVLGMSLPPGDLLKIAADLRKVRRLIDWEDMSLAAAVEAGTVADYAIRRSLKPRTMDYLLQPLTSVWSLSQPENTSMLTPFVCLTSLFATGGFFTFAQGVGFLPQGLARQLLVEYHAEVTSVVETANNVEVTWSRRGQSERMEQADACVIAVPPPQALSIFDQFTDDQRSYLAQTNFRRSIIVAFGLDRPTAERSMMLIVPRTEHPDILGFGLEHNLAPGRTPAGKGLVMAYLSDLATESAWSLEDAGITRCILNAANKLGILPELGSHCVTTYVTRIKHGVVARQPGDYRAATHFRRSLPPGSRVKLAGGDYFTHSATNNSVVSGEAAARRILVQLDGLIPNEGVGGPGASVLG
jgi:oxygen-dependent protoporphyrinogen oxidase